MRKLLNLGLSIERSQFNGKEFVATKDVPESTVKKTLKEKGHACDFCSFSSLKGQRVIKFPTTKESSSLVVICPLCFHANNMNYHANSMGAKLIFIPKKYGMSQSRLNFTVRLLWLASYTFETDSMEKMYADEILSLLNLGQRSAEEFVGSSSVEDFCNILESLSEEQYENRHQSFSGLFLLPSADAYEEELLHWAKEFKKSKISMQKGWKSSAVKEYMGIFSESKTPSPKSFPHIFRLHSAIKH